MSAIRRRLHGYYFKMRGLSLGKGASVHFSADIHHPNRVKVGVEGILYKHVSIYPSARGSFTMGDYSHVAPYGYFLIDANRVSIGKHVAIGPYCVFICHSNALEGESTLFSENYLDDDIMIGNNVFIGSHCTILPGTIIEDHVAVAANSVVKGRLQSHAVYGGSPAKLIKPLASS